MSQIIENEVTNLEKLGFDVRLSNLDGFFCVVIAAYPLPRGYSQSSSDLLLRIPVSYPNGKPDMFWLEKDVTLEDGSIPEKADVIERYLEKEWRRFSWHPKCWNPAIDTIETYLEFVNRRLIQVK